MTTFFGPGSSNDPAYLATRDDPRGADAKRFVEDLWRRFADLAEPRFLAEARRNFLERFWEMYLGVSLRSRGFNVHRHGTEGPDFLVHDRKTRVWVEAVAPGPGAGSDKVPQLVPGEFARVPTEQILLRYTNALSEKRRQFMTALHRRITSIDDSYLLALNSRGIRQLGDIGSPPYFLQAFLGLGSQFVDIDVKTGRTKRSGYLYRPLVTKGNASGVSMRGFLDTDMAFCSALLHSSVDCANHLGRLGADFRILHNPNARRPLPLSLFQWCEQFVVEGDRVRLVKAARQQR